MADSNAAFVTLACVQGVLTFVLVGATIYYARKTKDIASASRDQAMASVKMAEEMREQTVELRRTRSQQIRPVVRVNRVNGSLNGQPRVVIQNVGRGHATNGTARIEWQGSGFKPNSGWSLSPDADKDRPLIFEKDDAEAQNTVGLQPCVVIECDDDDGVRWRSGRNLRVDDNTGACDLAEEFGPEEVQT